MVASNTIPDEKDLAYFTVASIIRKQADALKTGLSLLLGKPSELPRNVALVARCLWNVQVRRKQLVVLARWGGLGDVICILGCVRGLRERHPNSWIVVITPTACSELVGSSSLPDAAADRRSFFHGFIKWLCPGAPSYHPLLPDEYDPPRPNRLHLAEEFARALDVPSDLSGVTVRAPPRTRRRLARRVKNVNPQRHPLVVLHPGPTWPVREWPAEYWCALAQRISESTSAVIIKIGTDLDSMGRVRPLTPIPNTVDWTNQLDVTETAALLEFASVLIGIDSGPLHIAGALGIPAVGLFGPIFGYLRLHPDARTTIVSSSVPCLGCHHRPTLPLHWKTGCPYDIICMREITVEDVFTAVRPYIGSDEDPLADIRRGISKGQALTEMD